MTTTSLEICNMALSLLGAKTIDSLTADARKEDRLCNQFYSPTLGEILELFAWNHAFEHRPLVLTDGYDEFNEAYDYDPVSVTGITAADPAVITAVSHGLVTGDYAYIYDVSGMTEVCRDLPYHVTKATDDTFTLTGIDSTNWTAYASGGYVRKMQPVSDYQDGFTYELPSDYGHAVSLEDPASEYLIKNNKLVTTVEDAVLIYIKNSGDAVDVAKFKDLFINVVAMRLAVKLCIPLLGYKNCRTIRQDLKEDYRVALNEAMLASAREINKDADTTDPWLAARR